MADTAAGGTSMGLVTDSARMRPLACDSGTVSTPVTGP